MKTIISSILIFLLFNEVSICQHNEPGFNTEELQFIIGNWAGTINAGVMKFTFVFKFWIDDDKILKGTLDSPEQDLIDIPINEIIIKDDSLKLDIRSIQRKYYAVMNKNDIYSKRANKSSLTSEKDRIRGNFKQTANAKKALSV